ncbi:hypothetical protein, partial [Halovivax sp.]|uniref:DUF7519 family protein n=1 Tax=Halovivax sp. TaxID=1935978 RepID=UPI0025BE7C5E
SAPAESTTDPTDPATAMVRTHERTTDRLAAVLGLGFTVLALAFLGGPIAVTFGVVSLLLFSWAIFRTSTSVATYAGGFLFAAVVVDGVTGATVEALLAALLAAILAWDVVRYGIVVGSQLGPEATTGRIVIAHVATSTVVGAAGGAVAYGVFRTVSVDAQNVAAAFLLLGAIALVIALR